MLRLSSSSQDSCPCGCKRCANIEKGESNQKKITFWAKKRRQNGFFGVFRKKSRTTLRNFAVILRLSSNSQDSSPCGIKRCDNNKKCKSNQKKITFWAKKLRKNGFFRVFRKNSRKRLRNFALMLRLSSNSQNRRSVTC